MRIISTILLRGAIVGTLAIATLALFTSTGPAAYAATTRPSSECSSETFTVAESTTKEAYDQFTSCTTTQEDAVITLNSSQPQSLEVQLCTQDLSKCTSFKRLGADGTVIFPQIPSSMYILGSLQYDPIIGAAVRPSGKLVPHLLDFNFTIHLFPVTFRAG